MRPVTSQPQVFNNRSGYGAGGYRAVVAFLVTGLLCLQVPFLVIGQAGTGQSSKNFNNICNPPEMGYYPGFLDLYRMGRRAGQD